MIRLIILLVTCVMDASHSSLLNIMHIKWCEIPNVAIGRTLEVTSEALLVQICLLHSVGR